MSLNMNGDNVYETSSIISSSLCNGFENTKNNLDNKNCSLSNLKQITTAQNELISIQRSLIRELLKNSKEFQEKFGDNYNAKNSNQHEQQTNKGGVECDAMHTDVESIRDEVCFVKSFRDLIRGLNGKEGVNNTNLKLTNVTSTKNKTNDHTFGQNEQDNKDTGFIYSENSQNQSSSQIKKNGNFFTTENPFDYFNETAEGGGSTNNNGVPFVNEFPRNRNNFVSSGPNDNLQSTSTSFQNNDNLNGETNEVNGDFFGEYKGNNSIYVGIGKENIDVYQLKQCLEENFGQVRFIRIIRNKNCAFAEFEEKDCFTAAIELGYISLNGANLKINKTFRKKKDN